MARTRIAAVRAALRARNRPAKGIAAAPRGASPSVPYVPALALLLLLVPLVFDTRGLNPFTTIKDALLPFGTSVAALLFLAHVVHGPPRAMVASAGGLAPHTGARLRWTLPGVTLAFALWSIIAPAWTATNPALHRWGAIHLTAYLIVFALAACAAARCRGSGRGTSLIAGAIAVSVLAMALHACLQALDRDPLSLIAGALRESGRWRVFATTGNPDWTAGYMAAAAPVAAWTLDQRRRGLGLLAWVLAGAAILATGSRLGLCALLAGGAWVAVTRRRARNHRTPPMRASRGAQAIAIVAAMAVAAAYALGHWGVPDLVVRWFDARSIGGRWILARSAWSLTLVHPVLGNGLGHFAALSPAGLAKVIPTLGPGWQDSLPQRLSEHVHNDFLEAAFAGGLPAGVLLLAMMAVALVLSWRLSRHDAHREPAVVPIPDENVASLAAVLGAVLIALLVEALGSAPLHTAATALLFWATSGLLAGCCWSTPPAGHARRIDEADAARRAHGTRWMRGLAGVLLPCAIAATIIGAIHGVRAVRANRMAATATSLVSAGETAEASGIYRNVVRLAPWDAESAVAMAALGLQRGDPFAALTWAHSAQAWTASRDAWLIEASAWERLGRPDRSIAALVKMLGALPDDREARRRLLDLVVRGAAKNQPDLPAATRGATVANPSPPMSP